VGHLPTGGHNYYLEKNNVKYQSLYVALIFSLALATHPVSASAETAIAVNVDNFDRAQTDFEFAGIVKLAGGINKLHSNRTLANPEDAKDLAIAHKLQDQVRISAGADKPFVLPTYDKASYKATLDAILELAKGLKRYTETFGSKAEVNPVHFLIGTASAWGGLPDKAAQYENVQPNLPVGKYELTVKDVPVKGFWSISLYNEKGYFQQNDLNAYSLNNLTARANSDGSYTIRFGGCTASTENCLPIMEGWNYAVRMYEPSEAIINGTWKFPGPPKPRNP